MASNTTVVRYLLDNGADPKRLDQIARSPLHVAASYATDTKIIITALHFAAHSSNVVAARHLIEMGAKPNLFDRTYGLSPLHLAAYYSKDTEITDLLLEALKTHQVDEGIDFFDNRHSIGPTALQYAAIASNETTAKHLIKRRGADPNRKDKFGCTPLHFAAFWAKDIGMVDVFLNNRQVDVNSLDNHERNVLNFAKCNEHGLTEEMLGRLNALRNPQKLTKACFNKSTI